jgi:hypothetical protein
MHPIGLQIDACVAARGAVSTAASSVHAPQLTLATLPAATAVFGIGREFDGHRLSGLFGAVLVALRGDAFREGACAPGARVATAAAMIRVVDEATAGPPAVELAGTAFGRPALAACLASALTACLASALAARLVSAVAARLASAVAARLASAVAARLVSALAALTAALA